jgi:hypothetical protein
MKLKQLKTLTSLYRSNLVSKFQNGWIILKNMVLAIFFQMVQLGYFSMIVVKLFNTNVDRMEFSLILDIFIIMKGKKERMERRLILAQDI